jgi:hypothetical protein
MVAAQFDIPVRNALVFVSTPVWTPEAEARFTFWRALDSDNENDRLLMGGAPKSGQGYVNGIINFNDRVLTTLPTYSKKVEGYFGQALIDSFNLDIYDTPFDDDIVSLGGGIRGTLKFAFNPYDRLFSKYIKPTRETVVFCKWEARKHGDTDWKLRAVGELQNAIDGGDVRWDHPDTKNPYLTRSYGTNKESNRETIWSLSLSHPAQTALGKIPARPTTNPNGTDSFYMPFYNTNPTQAAIDKGAVSALPYMSVLPGDPSPVAPKFVQIVDDFRYTDSVGATRRALWRRHISLSMFLKAVFDFAFIDENSQPSYLFTCEDSPIEFLGALLKTPTTLPPNGGTFVTPYQTEIDRFPDAGEQFRVINGHWDAPLAKQILLPQCLWGLYDEIACPAGDGIPLPTEHWGREHRSVWETILEICYSCGWEPSVKALKRIKPSDPKVHIHFRAKTEEFSGDKFTFVVPKDAAPQQFPESESGISIQRRATFKNALESDGEFDDWGSYKADGKTPGALYKDRTINQMVTPEGVEKPALIKMSMVFGADNSGAFIAGFAASSPRIHWYSTGYPNIDAAHVSECEKTERFPMFTPLVYAEHPAIPPVTAPTISGADIPVYFRPVVMGRFKVNGVYHNFSTWRKLLSAFYAMYYVRADVRYKITVPTITEFTSANNARDKGEIDFDQKELYKLVDIFDDEYFLRGYEEEWNDTQTTLELYKTRSLPRTELINNDGSGINSVDYHFPPPPVVTTVFNVTGNLAGTVRVVPMVSPKETIALGEMRIDAGAYVPMSKTSDGEWYYDLDTLAYLNGPHTASFRMTSIDGTTGSKAVTITIAN